MARGDAYEFVEEIPAAVFWTEEEKLEAADFLQPVLDNIRPGMGADWYEDDRLLEDFTEYTGLDYHSSMFWEAFREWYGENG